MPISNVHKNRFLYIGLPALLVLLVVMLRSLFFSAYRMKSEAMLPLIAPGKVLFINLQAKPKPGKVLLLRSQDEYADELQVYVARLLACPGDTLSVRSSQIWLNGKQVELAPNWHSDESYDLVLPSANKSLRLTPLSLLAYRKAISTEGDTGYSFEAGRLFKDGREQKHFKFQKDYYWVLCDNQDSGPDSRHFGIVAADEILGVVMGY